jgi:hypothetical protein
MIRHGGNICLLHQFSGTSAPPFRRLFLLCCTGKLDYILRSGSRRVNSRQKESRQFFTGAAHPFIGQNRTGFPVIF